MECLTHPAAYLRFAQGLLQCAQVPQTVDAPFTPFCSCFVRSLTVSLLTFNLPILTLDLPVLFFCPLPAIGITSFLTPTRGYAIVFARLMVRCRLTTTPMLTEVLPFVGHLGQTFRRVHC